MNEKLLAVASVSFQVIKFVNTMFIQLIIGGPICEKALYVTQLTNT